MNELARQAAAQVDLAAALRAALPPDLSEELWAASIRDDGTLVVLARSPPWAARLRFESEKLLARCREIQPTAKNIKVRVAAVRRPKADSQRRND